MCLLLVQGCQWNHAPPSGAPLFASINLPFRRKPQQELMPLDKLRELFDELDQHNHGRLTIADFRVRPDCCASHPRT